MPDNKIELENIANKINKMGKDEIETLLLLLCENGNELLNRKDQVINGKKKLISRNEAFGV